MKTKLALFGVGAMVITGALQGAIGQRDVYRDPQIHDACVTPGGSCCGQDHPTDSGERSGERPGTSNW